MSSQTTRLSDIEIKYPGSYRDAFEAMATHMFMKRLKLPEPPIRRLYQVGIEADPVYVPEDIDYKYKAGIYAFQAKYLDSRTEIANRKDKFINSIKTAQKEGVTDLIFYVNKDLHQVSRSGLKPSPELEIKKAADKVGIVVHWYTKTKIEMDLDLPAYRYIKELFLGTNQISDIAGFYEDICREMRHVDVNAAYGSLSLIDSYIEPVLLRRDLVSSQLLTSESCFLPEQSQIRNLQNVCDYIESWVTGEEYITILCGEPGHGKTSLCRKAVYDFYERRWLEKKVLNVFSFSVNPAGTSVQNTKRIDDITDLFSWGNAGKRQDHRIEEEDCGNALIFLDGFDELLEWIPGYNIDMFLEKVENFLQSFDSRYDHIKPHIVITTRKMVLPPRKKEYVLSVGREAISVPIYELQLIPEERQYEWIEKHVNSSSKASESYLARYKEMYKKLEPQDELKNILGIPIILRMIVTQEYMPKSGSRMSKIYEDLYDETWKRNNIRVKPEYDKKYMKKKLMRHALRIYADNNDSAEAVDQLGKEQAAWLYQFYTRYDDRNGKKKGKKIIYRIGFLHKTLYEHFLACEILSWFRDYEDTDSIAEEYSFEKKYSEEKFLSSSFVDMLSVLGKRKLSREVLVSIRDLYNIAQKKDEKEHIEDEVFDCAYRVLKRTDGILQLPGFNCGNEDSIDFETRRFLHSIAELMQMDPDVTPLVRGENVFFNVISICNVCGHPVNINKINSRAVRNYELNGIRLDKANFIGANLANANLIGAVLEGVNFTGVNLEHANLSSAVLAGNFTGVNFRRASMAEANLSKAIVYGADMEGALLSGVVFVQDKNETDISEANLEGARMSHAIISKRQIESINQKLLGKLPEEKTELEVIQDNRIVSNDHIFNKKQSTEGSYSLKQNTLNAFGHYKQGANGEVEPLSWRILKKDQEKMLVTTEKLVDFIPYHRSKKDITWANCSLHEWMNEDFLYGAFNENERARIIRVRNQTSKNSYGGGVGTRDSRPTWDWIFALSIEDIKDCFDSTNEDRRAVITPYLKKNFNTSIRGKRNVEDYFGWWWLRSPGFDNDSASAIDADGSIDFNGEYVNYPGICVRPALWIHL